MTSSPSPLRRSRTVLAIAALLVTIGSYSCGRIRQDGSGELPDGQDADTSGALEPDGPGRARDAGATDAGTPAVDASSDASVYLPPIDPTLPAPEPACGAATGMAYLVSESGAFYTFDPATSATTKLGTLKCPTVDATPWPFTMTLTQTDAYVLYTDGNIYRVSLDSLACTRTGYDGSQLGYPGDVGIATSPGPKDSLLVLGFNKDVPDLAATKDLTAFTLHEIGPITPLPQVGYPVDVKVDGYGRLFAADSAGALLMIEAATGRVLGLDQTGLTSPSAWALLTYNDGIYFFTGDSGDTFRWDLQQKAATRLGTVGDKIAGAGSAPCLH